MFNKILIANRGEIACRIIQASQQMGIIAVAVYSEADIHAKHVAMADEAYLIGPAPAALSYLAIDNIMSAAGKAGVQAIHPGYGFLSENPRFARACQQASIEFIGPPIAAIESMGSKSAAKNIAKLAGIPLTPSYHGNQQDPDFLAREADKIGYPVLIKAVAGGGGKGMRTVWQAGQFKTALAAARREAQSAFADDHVLIEKYLLNPRHIEIQIFADLQGQVVHLFERDCSMQRRYQKVLEEAPAPGLSEKLRNDMGNMAVKMAKAIDYVGAGTVEFLLDEQGNFFFMEMNTRLQVEHPITEMITGIDLVAWQLKVAAGEKLPLSQQQISYKGHAFEVRIYAEDVSNDFLPAAGTVTFLREPSPCLPYMRIDSGIQQGDEIGIHYDPMLAKLIVWDQDRSRCLRRLQQALQQFYIVGLSTNLSFLLRLSQHKNFAGQEINTGFISEHLASLKPQPNTMDNHSLALAALYLLLHRQQQCDQAAAKSTEPHSPWHLVHSWRLNGFAGLQVTFIENLLGKELETHIKVYHQSSSAYRVNIGRKSYFIQAAQLADNNLQAHIDGQLYKITLFQTASSVYLMASGQQRQLKIKQMEHSEEQCAHPGGLTAPMTGTLLKILVAPSQQVEQGQQLMILEAMKMEHSIIAPGSGTVGEIFCCEGDNVNSGLELLTLLSNEPTK